MSDIVERLRACDGIKSGDPDCCCKEAAAEIERLRDLWTGREDEINRLRLALREIADSKMYGTEMREVARAALEGKP